MRCDSMPAHTNRKVGKYDYMVAYSANFTRHSHLNAVNPPQICKTSTEISDVAFKK